MSDHVAEIDRLLAASRALEYGPARTALAEEAVRLADGRNDLKEGFRTRRELASASVFAGQPEVMLVAFSWCLAQCDRDPAQFKERDLLWEYKWVVDNLPDFARVTRGQIEAALADMERRYRRCGSTMHAYHQKRRDVLRSMGDLAGAVAADAELARTRRDWLSDCLACTMDMAVGHLAALGRYEEALAAAAPVLEGRHQCAEVPHRTYARVLLPLMRLGRLAEAMSYHRKGYRLVARNPDFVSQTGQHILFLAMTENLAKGTTLLEKHLPAALATVNEGTRFGFYRAAFFLLERLAEQGKASLKLRLPEAFPPRPVKGRYTTADLAGWFQSELTDLARSFDARNGNGACARRVAELQELKALVTPHPLTDRKAADEQES